ncbi:oxoglutarate/iron-dependent oxygenase [Pseudohyphozyma bogoriensis]|nr:oxoglutarate/iron-dependent oxygenase [Pseudohyphozyma bogoriensis]
MTASHAAPSSPPPTKRSKTSTKTTSTDNPDAPFHPDLFPSLERLANEHAGSKPYNHAVIPQLFEKEFLDKAREEIVSKIRFTEKETDICEFALLLVVPSFARVGRTSHAFLAPVIAQTGDLTNLSGLPESELALLPTLLKLRDALYSAKFRSLLRSITGCGPLSGIKTDMSCAEYSNGSYLLNHDDVIGTRRVSFILYLVKDEPAWKPEWGGALELYPVLPADPNNPDRPNVPEAKPSVSIPPAFNQLAFFVVQPGHSFHSVEEVVVHGDGVRGGVGSRMSLSGWFHKPVEGEEGYDEEVPDFAAKSSLQQLYATTLSPPIAYDNAPTLPLPLVPSADESTLLKKLLNPAYLDPTTLSHLRTNFVESSQLLLSNFLKPDTASELEALIREVDAKGEVNRRGVTVGGQKVDLIPSFDLGESEEEGWVSVGPPHIQRFLSLVPKADTSSSSRLTVLLNDIHTLIRSDAFRSLLASFTSLLPLDHTTHVRRLRPGLDFTLARGEPSDGEAMLDVGLGLTPVPSDEADQSIWEEGETGGWDMWLATEEGDDEATYGGGQKKKEGGEGEEEEDDGPLLALEPAWNTLSLVLRDPGVLRFTKYVGARAPGSRWDVTGEWGVGMVEDEEEGEGEE